MWFGVWLLVMLAGLGQAGPVAAADEVIHVVQPGENLFRIGLRYGVNWQTLMSWNGLSDTRIYPGQQLVVGGNVTPGLAAEGASTVHVVQPGETLFSIGLLYGLDWHALMIANGLRSSWIFAGQTLTIPDQLVPAGGQASENGQRQIVVLPGDTLWQVAQRHDITMDALAAANGLGPQSWLYAGQRLTLPAGATVADGVLLPVTGRVQALPLDCEARSAVDWAAYFGVTLDELAFFDSLPRSDNPDLGFVGDVYGVWGQIPPGSYGVHAEPVAAGLNQYGLAARTVRGGDWQSLRAELDAGRPVIVWVVGHVTDGSALAYTDNAGVTTTVARYEHTVIVAGYGGEMVFVLDGGTVYGRQLDLFLRSWAVLGNMAIVAGD